MATTVRNSSAATITYARHSHQPNSTTHSTLPGVYRCVEPSPKPPLFENGSALSLAGEPATGEDCDCNSLVDEAAEGDCSTLVARVDAEERTDDNGECSGLASPAAPAEVFQSLERSSYSCCTSGERTVRLATWLFHGLMPKSAFIICARASISTRIQIESWSNRSNEPDGAFRGAMESRSWHS